MPRTFCITLKETPLRTRAFLDSSIKSGLKIDYFYGTFGSKVGLSSKYSNILETNNPNVFLTEGAIGCMLSHYTLWKVLQYQPEEEFLVVEDDALFCDEFQKKFEEVYAKLPSDWEFVYVGWVPYGHDNPPIVVDEGISIRLPSATHAYLVKRTALEKLSQAILPMQSPLDLTFIHRVLPTIRYYVFDPPLVTQRSYLNTTDPIWTSLVYDWDNDLYGCKKNLLDGFEFKEGWHPAERSETDVWKWSSSTFKLKFPDGLSSIEFVCSTPFENILVMNGESFPLKLGNNVVRLNMNGNELEGITKTSFVPSKQDPSNSDDRVLGVCLKRLNLYFGGTMVPVKIADKSGVPPPHSFKI